MAITAFNDMSDGLDPHSRNRGHYIVNTNLNDDGPWIPYADGVWIQPCSFNVTTGGFTVLVKGLPGAKLGVHYHVGTVRGYTIRGRWRYLEHDWIAGPGTFVYEPAGEAHTLVITEDSPEPALILFMVEGGLVYLDKGLNGSFAAFEDGFSALELSRKYYREAGFDIAQLNQLIR
jgi:quercetin dioxygenase-like cupin family protein